MKHWGYWVTWIIILITVIQLIVWDIFVATNKYAGDTISEIIQSYAFKYTFVPLAFGILAGHFFWPGESIFPWWQKIIILVFLGSSTILVDVYQPCMFNSILKLLHTYPIILFLISIPLGRIIWPQPFH